MNKIGSGLRKPPTPPTTRAAAADCAPKLELTICAPGSFSSAQSMRSSAVSLSNDAWHMFSAARRLPSGHSSLIDNDLLA